MYRLQTSKVKKSFMVDYFFLMLARLKKQMLVQVPTNAAWIIVQYLSLNVFKHLTVITGPDLDRDRNFLFLAVRLKCFLILITQL